MAWSTALDLECPFSVREGEKFLRTDGQDISTFSIEIEDGRVLVARGSYFLLTASR